MNTTEQIALKIAHRTCTTYSHNERIKYMFTDQNMIDFAEKFLAAWLEQQSQEPVAYMAPSGTCVTAEDVSYTPNWTDYYTIPLYAAPPAKVDRHAEITALKKEKNVHKSKYLAIHPNKCRPQDSLGIDYHWCGNGQGGTPNVELQFDPTTGNLVGVVFIPKDARWGKPF